MKKFPTVAIIFPTHDNWGETRDCLESITSLDYPKDKLEVIVVDNASTDGTPEKLKEFTRKPTIRLIENRTNLGFAKAVNLGVKKTKSELILITNNDIAFEKNSLAELVKTLITKPKVAVVGGQVYWKNNNQPCVNCFRLNPYLGYHQFDLSNSDQIRECDWISGSCFLAPKKLFLNLGGFDEEYFFYFEDIDFCLKAKRAGYKLLYCPKAILYHSYGKTISKESVEKIFYLGYASRWRCLLKNANSLQIISSFFFLLFSAGYQSFLTRHNIYKPMLKGLISNFKNHD